MKAAKKLAKKLTPPKELLADLVLANKILFGLNVVDAFGHISVRHPNDPNHYLMARHLPPGMVTAKDIVLFDMDSTPLTHSDKPQYSERFIHSEIYKLRPDVMSVVHCHAHSLIPFGAAKGARLRPMFHMCGFLGCGVPIFEIRKTGGNTDMLIRTAELGRALAETLGDKNVVLMRGHGATMIGNSIPEVGLPRRSIRWRTRRSRCRRICLSDNGEVEFLNDEEAEKSSRGRNVPRAWSLWKQRVQQDVGRDQWPLPGPDPRRGIDAAMLKSALAALRPSVSALSAANADAVEDFYKGKTITVVTSTGVGGPFDLTARALAKHMPRYIPGRPTMIVRNMPGGGHVLATNFMFHAGREGRHRHRHRQQQRAAAPGARRPRRALRRAAVLLARLHRHQQPDDGGLAHVRLQDHGRRDGARADHRRHRHRLRHLHLSERHEHRARHQVQDRDGLQEHRRARSRAWSAAKSPPAPARASPASCRSARPGSKAIKVVVLNQIGDERDKAFPQVPLMHELAKTTEQRQILNLLSLPPALGRPFFTTPDVPADRAAALRRAFEATMKDEAFLKEAQAAQSRDEPVRRRARRRDRQRARSMSSPELRRQGEGRSSKRRSSCNAQPWRPLKRRS